MGKNNIPLSTLSSIKKRRVYRKLDPRIVLSIHEKSLTVYHLKKIKIIYQQAPRNKYILIFVE